MDARMPRVWTFGMGRVALIGMVAWLAQGAVAPAQQAQINIDDPKGESGGSSLVGGRLGAAAFSDGAPGAVTPLTGRTGFSASHAPVSGVTVQQGAVMNPAQVSFKPPSLQPASLPTYGSIELPRDLGLALGEEAYGPEGQRRLVEGIATRRLGAVADIVHAVLFFASDEAGWISGQTLSVDGGK